MTTVNVYNRGLIMRRAWEIARARREEIARDAHAKCGVSVIGGRVIFARTFEAVLAETPIDLAAAMKAAWAEAKRGEAAPAAASRNALVVMRRGELAPMRRRFRFSRVLPLLARIGRFISSRYIGRAA